MVILMVIMMVCRANHCCNALITAVIKKNLFFNVKQLATACSKKTQKIWLVAILLHFAQIFLVLKAKLKYSRFISVVCIVIEYHLLCRICLA